MDWQVFYYQTERGDSPVEEFLNALSVKARAKCLAYISQLEQFGNQLPSSYVSKVRDDVWELRPEWGGVEHRFLYFMFVEKRIVIVHALKKKSQKLKTQDIDVAEARVADVRARYEREQKAINDPGKNLQETQEAKDEPKIAPAIRQRPKE